MKISIIIPCYNVEKYIIQLVSSLLKQIDGKNIEIICVNDGSTDNTLNCLKSLATGNNNLHIINQENGGPASARNSGLDIAKGEYIWFVDGDDSIDKHAINTLTHEIEEKFSVADFKNMCYDKIDDILSRNKKVIIVGGTGLYINSIVYDMNFSTELDDNNCREELIKEAKEKGNDYLYRKLKEVDPDSAKVIHPNNVKRVIRALEIASNSGNLKSTHMEEEGNRLKKFSHPRYEFYIYCIDYPRDLLYERINKRVDIMIELGVLKEAKMVYDMKLNPSCTCMQSIGYKEFFGYFDGEISLDEAISNLKKSTRHYAKRQMTWFNNKLDCKYLNGYNDV